MTLRSTIRCLLLAAVGLPIAHLVFIWVGGLLRAMGDVAGAGVLGHIGTAVGVLWALVLVGLVVVLAVKALDEQPPNQ